jgi:hypothetical protein
MWHAWEKREKGTRFRWESQKERDHSEDQDGDGIRMYLRETGWGLCIGFEWHGIGAGGEL